jgi:hypothetical protein
VNVLFAFRISSKSKMSLSYLVLIYTFFMKDVLISGRKLIQNARSVDTFWSDIYQHYLMSLLNLHQSMFSFVIKPLKFIFIDFSVSCIILLCLISRYFSNFIYRIISWLCFVEHVTSSSMILFLVWLFCEYPKLSWKPSMRASYP